MEEEQPKSRVLSLPLHFTGTLKFKISADKSTNARAFGHTLVPGRVYEIFNGQSAGMLVPVEGDGKVRVVDDADTSAAFDTFKIVEKDQEP